MKFYLSKILLSRNEELLWMYDRKFLKFSLGDLCDQKTGKLNLTLIYTQAKMFVEFSLEDL